MIEPMTNNGQYHDPGEKTIMGHRFPKSVDAAVEMDRVMDLLLHHPSTAPNISKGLIQKLTTSNPSPDYVRRVTEVFLNNGEGAVGDLKAVVWAILADEEVYTAAPMTMSKDPRALVIFGLYLPCIRCTAGRRQPIGRNRFSLSENL